MGKYDNAAFIYHQLLMMPLFFQFGAYQLEIELVGALFENDQEKLLKMKNADRRAWALNELASAYSMIGRPLSAIPLFDASNNIYSKESEYRTFMVAGLGSLATQQLSTGALLAAEHNIHQSINLCHELELGRKNAGANQELARIWTYRGMWNDAKRVLAESKKYFNLINDVQSLCIGELYQSMLFLMIGRSKQLNTQSVKLAMKFAQHAFKLAESGDPNQNNVIVLRDLLEAKWLLGASSLAGGELLSAENYIGQALSICRSINSVDIEASVLLELAKLQYKKGNVAEAKPLAEEALSITERCGYVLQGADVNLFLAQYALEQEKDKVKAKEYAESALKLATCDGPPYYYKVAYEEAERFLENLK